MTTPVAIILGQDLLALQAKVRAFAEQEVRPIAADLDRIDDPLQTFPWEVWRKASRLGLRTLPMSAEHGGIGMDVLTHVLLLEELCVVDSGFGASFHQTWKFQKLLLVNDYVRQHHLPNFLADDDYNVRVPDAARLSEVGQGQAFRGSFGRPYTTGTPVFAIATARAVFEQSLDWCRNQRRDGKVLADHPDVALRLADMWADVELARAINLKATWSVQHNPNHLSHRRPQRHYSASDRQQPRRQDGGQVHHLARTATRLALRRKYSHDDN